MAGEPAVELSGGRRIDLASQTLGQFLTGWLAAVRSGLRARAWETYEEKLRNYVFGTELARIPLAKLTGQHIALHREQILVRMGRNGRPLSPRTVGHVLTALHVALEAAKDWRIIGHNPVDGVKRPKIETEEGAFFLPEELAKVLTAVQGDDLEAMWALFVSGGMRPGETLGLRREAVNLDQGFLVIVSTIRTRGKPLPDKPKSKKGWRTVPLPETAVTALRAHFDRQRFVQEAAGPAWQEQGFVFTTSWGGPLSHSFIVRRWKALLKRAEVTYREPYAGRRTYASMIRNDPRVSDFIAAQVMGHFNVSLTDRVYAQALPAPLQQVGQVVEEQIRRALGN